MFGLEADTKKTVHSPVEVRKGFYRSSTRSEKHDGVWIGLVGVTQDCVCVYDDANLRM